MPKNHVPENSFFPQRSSVGELVVKMSLIYNKWSVGSCGQPEILYNLHEL
jgi:hypothetical protein